MARTAAAIVPPSTPTLAARWLVKLAPLAMASGSIPAQKASEVMRMGRKRSRLLP